MYDVVVIGASVSGCRVATLASLEGFKTLVLEEHKEVGKPLKCAGLVSWRLLKILPRLPSETIVNVVHGANFFSPTSCLSLKSKKPMYVIDRVGLDKFLAREAISAGAKIKLGERFREFKYVGNHVKIFTNRGNYRARLLIGADGFVSTVANVAGIAQIKKTFVGMQGIGKGSFNPKYVELWLGSEITPNSFGWVIPEDETKARIGLAVESGCKFYFQKFAKMRMGKAIKPTVIATLGFGFCNSVSERILLVGDAAGMIKPFSLGGIIYALIGSEICVDACKEAFEEERFDEGFLRKVYERKWKERLFPSMRRGYFLRKLFGLRKAELRFFFWCMNFFKLKSLLQLLDVDLL